MSKFSDLYPATRYLLGDTGAVPTYTNSQLDMGLSVALLQEVGFSETTPDASGNRLIAPDVVVKADQLRIPIRAAIGLLSPNGGALNWKTKALSVQRENQFIGYISELKATLRELVNGTFVLAAETEWDQFTRGPYAALLKLQTFPWIGTIGSDRGPTA